MGNGLICGTPVLVGPACICNCRLTISISARTCELVAPPAGTDYSSKWIGDTDNSPYTHRL